VPGHVASHGTARRVPLQGSHGCEPWRFQGVAVSRLLHLTICYLYVFYLRTGIRLALLAHRLSPEFGDWCADRFGVTAAYRRGRAFLALPVRGNAL
jgi:hypothetical protein